MLSVCCWHRNIPLTPVGTSFILFPLAVGTTKPVPQSANLCQPDSACHVINGLAY